MPEGYALTRPLYADLPGMRRRALSADTRTGAALQLPYRACAELGEPDGGTARPDRGRPWHRPGRDEGARRTLPASRRQGRCARGGSAHAPAHAGRRRGAGVAHQGAARRGVDARALTKAAPRAATRNQLWRNRFAFAASCDEYDGGALAAQGTCS